MPALFLECLVLVPGVLVYSPTYIDADNFHQRIVLEHLWGPSVTLLVPLGIALLVSVSVKLVLRQRRRASEASRVKEARS